MTKQKIEVKEKYFYNKEDDKYVIDANHRIKPLVLSGYKVRAIRKSISNFFNGSETGADICLKYKITNDDFLAIKKAFDLIRDSFPLTDEELTEDTQENNLEKLLEQKRSDLAQSFEKEDWKETQKDASSWRKFINKQLDPFAGALDNWTPPEIKKITSQKYKNESKTLCIALSDLHWGLLANPKYMYNDKGGWNSEKTSVAVNAYLQGILKMCKERTHAFKKVAVFLMGDILHSVSGKTCRGTELKYDTIREEQFEYALNSLTLFLQKIITKFPDVEIHTTVGNHNPEAEIGIYRALEMAFRKNNKAKFFHHTSRPASFVLGNTLFIMEHGQSNTSDKAYVPLAENKLESHVQKLLLHKPELLTSNIKSKIFCMGDRHNFKHIEYDNFDFIMFSTIVQSDEHADTNNWNNRARQSCLVLDDNGLSEILHFYTDSK